MRIERFDPRADDERLRTCHEIFEAGRPHDDPTGPPMSLAAFRIWWAYGFTGDPRQVWLAADQRGPVGCYLLELPERENERVAVCLPVVAPAARRRGVGTTLLAHCGAQARDAGRTLLSSEPRQGSAGEAFARAAGGRGGLTEVRRVLKVDDQLPDRLARLRTQAEAAAAGYRLLSWPGATPAEQLGQVARLTGAMADAPRSDSLEAEHWDAARVQETEGRCLAQGLRLYTVAACHPATGELSALTQVVQDPATPGWALQGLTAVLREHRGRRLGLLVKVAMQQWLAEREPGVRFVLTENAEANEHMVAINEQLGFAISDRFRQWELELGEPGSPQS